EANRLLATASRMVTAATRTAIYDTTPAGLPDDDDVADAFRDATVAQVVAWVRLGLDPATGPAGVTGPPASSSIGSASVNLAAREGQGEDRVKTVVTLVPEAWAILDEAGLVGHQPIIW